MTDTGTLGNETERDMLRFHDFAPRLVKRAQFFKPEQLEDLDEALVDLNDWLVRTGVEVVNVETIVLPNIHSPHEDGTADPSLHVSGDHGSRWYQVFRVWYKVPQELEPG